MPMLGFISRRRTPATFTPDHTGTSNRKKVNAKKVCVLFLSNLNLQKIKFSRLILVTMTIFTTGVTVLSNDPAVAAAGCHSKPLGHKEAEAG